MLSSQQNSQVLIRGLAHEIKNPLGGLRGAAQLLAKELPEEHLTDYTNIIIEEADRLSNLVNRMLGSHDLMKIHPVNIHEVLERVKIDRLKLAMNKQLHWSNSARLNRKKLNYLGINLIRLDSIRRHVVIL